MPRKRQAGRMFSRGPEEEPRDVLGSSRWWRAKFERAIAAGELPVVVKRCEIRNFLGYQLATANTCWPMTFNGRPDAA